MNELVSILIPTYNRKNIVCHTIESALAQTYNNIEVIIVDDHSSDNTYSAIKKFYAKDQRVKVYKNLENLGAVKNWIQCLKYSRGEYIKFLFSDDLIEPNFLEKTLPYMRNEKVAFAYSKVYIFSGNIKMLRYNLFNRDTVYPSRQFCELSILHGRVPQTPPAPGCALFRRADVVENLILDIPASDDLDFHKTGAGNDQLLYLLTQNKYPEIAYVNSTSTYFRRSEDSMSRLCGNKLYLYYDWAKFYFLKRTDDAELLYLFKEIIKEKTTIQQNKLLYKNLLNSIEIELTL